jgi:hypothetical protein
MFMWDSLAQPLAVPQTAPNATTCLICTISLFDEATPPHPPYQNDEKYSF